MKMLTKLLIGALVIGTGVAIASGGEDVVSKGERRHSETGRVAEWKIVREKEGRLTGHIKLPGEAWEEVGESDSDTAVWSLIDTRLNEDGYMADQTAADTGTGDESETGPGGQTMRAAN